jgi:hypothetical protein
LHNFELVLKILTPFETACLYCRVGILNIYNPCKPEGAWQLDLSHYDERIVAKTLCLLSTVEPGVNWTSQEFRWQRNMDPMPGWELTQMWMTDEGMPSRGFLKITYFSGATKNLKGCCPFVNYRLGLLHAVLINEGDYMEEEARGRRSLKNLSGDQNAVSNVNVWKTYVFPPRKGKVQPLATLSKEQAAAIKEAEAAKEEVLK